MKYALFTTHWISPVEDEEQAAEAAIVAQKAVELNVAAVFEQNALTEAEATELGFRFLGTSVAVFDGSEVLA